MLQIAPNCVIIYVAIEKIFLWASDLKEWKNIFVHEFESHRLRQLSIRPELMGLFFIPQ